MYSFFSKHTRIFLSFYSVIKNQYIYIVSLKFISFSYTRHLLKIFLPFLTSLTRNSALTFGKPDSILTCICSTATRDILIIISWINKAYSAFHGTKFIITSFLLPVTRFFAVIHFFLLTEHKPYFDVVKLV